MPDPDHRPTLEYGLPDGSKRVSLPHGLCLRMGLLALLVIVFSHFFYEARLISFDAETQGRLLAEGIGVVAFFLGIAGVLIDRRIRWMTITGMITGLLAAGFFLLGRARH